MTTWIWRQTSHGPVVTCARAAALDDAGLLCSSVEATS